MKEAIMPPLFLSSHIIPAVTAAPFAARGPLGGDIEAGMAISRVVIQ